VAVCRSQMSTRRSGVQPLALRFALVEVLDLMSVAGLQGEDAEERLVDLVGSDSSGRTLTRAMRYQRGRTCRCQRRSSPTRRRLLR
jgi:hypothetical protein